MSESYYHSVRFDAGLCDGCLACVRVCPTQAVRVRGGTAVMLEDRCIDCGECFKVCEPRAVRSLTGSLAELSKFDYTVAVPSPALYTQFDSAVTPAVVLEALRRIGFDEAVGLSAACAAASVAIERHLGEFRGQHPVISSSCPTVVRLIQVKYPTLLDQLLPMLSPREVAAREVKQRTVEETGLAPERIGVVYVTPCPAKMVSLVDHPGMDRSYFDSAVSISDLFLHLMAAVAEIEDGGRVPAETESATGLSWSLSTGLAGSLPAEDTLAVAGLANVVRILDDIEKGKLGRYTFVDCHACPEGCVSGVLTIEDPYVARARAIRLIRALGPDRDLDRAKVGREYESGGFRMPHRVAARPMRPLHDDIAVAITRMTERDRLLSALPRIDCGACGAPTCETFADDVVRGEVTEEACVFIREKRIEAVVKELAALVRRQTPPAITSDGTLSVGASASTGSGAGRSPSRGRERFDGGAADAHEET